MAGENALADPADLVRGNAALLAGYLPLLEDEITEPPLQIGDCLH